MESQNIEYLDIMTTAVEAYRHRTATVGTHFRAALIDMDGTLYDSMSNHTAAWHRLASELGFDVDRDSFYLYEGMTGRQTINRLFSQFLGTTASEEEVAELYHRKTVYFNELPKPLPMPGAREMLASLKAMGVLPVLVTGSGQASLIDRLNRDFPGIFTRETMITSRDVKNGKPHPEPYLKGMACAGTSPGESIVIENAPLGVKAGAASGAFTVALTTGPIPVEAMRQAGADLVLPSMPHLARLIENLLTL